MLTENLSSEHMVLVKLQNEADLITKEDTIVMLAERRETRLCVA